MIDEQDWKILNARLESIERSIDMLRVMFPVPQAPMPSKPADLTRATRPYGALGEIPCVFDNMPESEKMKPMCISCPCPRCSPYALSMGSLTDAGLRQEWQTISFDKPVDCISNVHFHVTAKENKDDQ